MKTKMKATVVNLTKELAKYYLDRNDKNRKINKTTLRFYKSQMKNGLWKENGEAIIIDVNGVVKDGQHRLLAVLETGIPYKVPVITDVSASVMDTIDTGRNRTASDVLHLEGFKYASLIASSVKMILSDKFTEDSTHNSKISNSIVLDYAVKNEPYIYELIEQAQKISSLQVLRVLTDTQIVFYLHKYKNNSNTVLFLKNILGIIREPRTATDYVYKKLFRAKSGDERLSLLDKQKYIERSYDYFLKGNPTVKGLKIKYNNKYIK